MTFYDDKAYTINDLIEAVIAIEDELGSLPAGAYASVRTRLDILEARINNPYAPSPNVNNPFYIGGSPVSGVSIQDGYGDPRITLPPAIPGSLYLREDGYAIQGLYAFRPDGYWHQIDTDPWTAAGDLSGNSYSQTVIGIQGRPVKNTAPQIDAAGDGYVLTWGADGYWEPQIGFYAAGDLSGNKLSQTLVNIQGNRISAHNPSDGYVLTWSATDVQWEPQRQAVVFDTVAGETNIRSNRFGTQSPVDHTKIGIVNLGSDSTQLTSGVTANYSSILGGDKNQVSNVYSTVVGGVQNIISGSSIISAFIGSGQGNDVSGSYSAIMNGFGNAVSGNYSYVVGGEGNSSSDSNSFIGSGIANNIELGGGYNVIGSGNTNIIMGATNSVILSGASHLITSSQSLIGTGSANNVGANNSIILNGASNTVSGPFSTVLNGSSNSVSGQNVTLLNGTSNIVSSNNAVVNGLSNTVATADYSIVTGNNNSVSSTYALVDGYSNTVSSGATFANLFGWGNTTASQESFVKGRSNTIGSASQHSYIFGTSNVVSSGIPYTFIDGYQNIVTNGSNVTMWGNNNTSTSHYSNAWGSYNNLYADYSSVFGQYGQSNYPGQMVQSSAPINGNVGSAQFARTILSGSAISGGEFGLLLAGDGYMITQDNQSYDMNIRVLVVNTTGTPYTASFVFDVLAHQTSGVLVIDYINATPAFDPYLTNWSVQITTDGANHLIIQVPSQGTLSRRAIATVEWRELSRA